jgi:RNAse (barnase) inhibitor barstar
MAEQPISSFEFVADINGFRAPSWQVVCLTGKMRRKQDLLRALASRLKFPNYFGWNWDALEECLCDLSWLKPQAGIVLLHKHLPLADLKQRQTYLDILKRAQTAGQIPLRIVFPQSAQERLENHRS